MRLYDRLMEGALKYPPSLWDGEDFDRAQYLVKDFDRLSHGLGSSVRIDATNVAEFIYTGGKYEWDWWDDFPGVMPPFESSWIEFSIPRVQRGWDGRLADIGWTPPKMGVLVTCDSSSDRTWVYMESFGLLPDKSLVQISTLRYAVTPSGCIDGNDLTFSSFREYETDEGDYRFEGFDVGTIFFTPLLTLSFLNCKNVVLEDAPFKGSRQHRRALERKGIKQTKFKTLVIEPMKQVLKTEGGIEHNGLKKALHICRGHFATYSDDRPLFGKYSGTYWKPAHVRGNADNGTVYKDYKVKAPKEQP